MPPLPNRPDELAWQVFRGSDVLRRRLLTPHQLRGTAWVHVLHDVYADARLDRTHELKCRAALLRLPPDAVLAGPSAAHLDGIEHAAGYDDDVHVIVPTTLHTGPQRGMRVHSTDLAVDEMVERDGVTRTSPARTAWDVGSWLGVLGAVPIIDSLLARRLLTPANLARQAARCAERHRRGSRRARLAFRLADGRARSPEESVLRVRLVLAGLPPPVPRHPVRLPTGAVLLPPLAWPEYRVAVEPDAPSLTADPDQLRRHRRRLTDLTAAGWLVLRVGGQRTQQDLDAAARDIRRALATRGWPHAGAVAA